jgi:DNA-binding LytR/AlgR family response regulator
MSLFKTHFFLPYSEKDFSAKFQAIASTFCIKSTNYQSRIFECYSLPTFVTYLLKLITNAMKTKFRNPQKVHKKLLSEAPKNIIRLEANVNYTTFILQTGRTQTMSYNLAIYGSLLPQSFIRVNRSCIINKNFIDNLNIDNKKVTLKDGTQVQISRRRWVDVLQWSA